MRYPLYELEGEGFGGRRSLAEDPSFQAWRTRESSQGDALLEATSVAEAGRARRAARRRAGPRQSVLSVVTRERTASLLYSDVLWKLINDKWHVFGRPRFFWFAALSLVCQMLLTLSLCREDGDRCEGVLVVLVLPLPLEISVTAARYCYYTSLGMHAVLLLRLLFALTRLGALDRRSLLRSLLGVLAHLLPWAAFPFQYVDDGLYRMLLGIAAALGWPHRRHEVPPTPSEAAAASASGRPKV